MRVLLAGGTGMIGKALTKSLVKDGHTVAILTRNPEHQKNAISHRVLYIPWDGKNIEPHIPAHGAPGIGRVDVIVNLAGEKLAKWPWTTKQKQIFLQSRITSGEALTKFVQLCDKKPSTFIQISGINYYGARGAQVDESSSVGDDFLARLAQKWEEASAPVEASGVRRCILRLGVVLEKNSGLFPLMALPVKFFLGGPLGSGEQIISWIHLDDVTGIIRFLIDNQEAAGVFNGVAPDPVSNKDFYKILAGDLKKPYWLRVPELFLRTILGGMSVLILDGRPVLPRRIIEAGYLFKMDNIRAAVASLV